MAPESYSACEEGFLALPPDIWSLGVSLYTFMNKELPFYSENEFELQNKIEENEFPKLEGFSDIVSNFLAHQSYR